MRPVFFAVIGVVLGTFLLPAPAAWAAPPKAKPAGQSDVYKIAIEPSVSLSEAAESMRLRANALNLQLVAELPMSKQVEAVTGKPQRTITIFQFCDAVLAKDLIDVNLEFAIYMPCRIALIEDASGRGWLVMMDVNVGAVAQEKRLPPVLKTRIETVRKSLVEIMQAGAKGEL
ncbi:MAG: DUF302 domain-containing protein [Thiobacillus sp.]|jgi:uncharacterized protein (DUF302 family)|uniref:DUF302 domain-containing protein n=1 Tax=Thiobacillus sp. TaxID=924 RepID=UPI0028958E1C|nr:DUF302 domain-containing protein [Thiobacillus sp.]MDT3705848.1 DUF302 domain-containing protein [Thiobacillus sp.]